MLYNDDTLLDSSSQDVYVLTILHQVLRQVLNIGIKTEIFLVKENKLNKPFLLQVVNSHQEVFELLRAKTGRHSKRTASIVYRSLLIIGVL